VPASLPPEMTPSQRTAFRNYRVQGYSAAQASVMARQGGGGGANPAPGATGMGAKAASRQMAASRGRQTRSQSGATGGGGASPTGRSEPPVPKPNNAAARRGLQRAGQAESARLEKAAIANINAQQAQMLAQTHNEHADNRAKQNARTGLSYMQAVARKDSVNHHTRQMNGLRKRLNAAGYTPQYSKAGRIIRLTKG
jgi:hypothetical protein